MAFIHSCRKGCCQFSHQCAGSRGGRRRGADECEAAWRTVCPLPCLPTESQGAQGQMLLPIGCRLDQLVEPRVCLQGPATAQTELILALTPLALSSSDSPVSIYTLWRNTPPSPNLPAGLWAAEPLLYLETTPTLSESSPLALSGSTRDDPTVNRTLPTLTKARSPVSASGPKSIMPLSSVSVEPPFLKRG